ncbi:MAG: hypothetical protein MJ174_07700 [Treponema sp.]|nr:hypothetical protein [Treponema sp.]
MKLDQIFTVNQNKLIKIENNSEVDISTLEKIEIKWSTVELAEESYNEEYLAALRDNLKTLDDGGKFAILIPVVDKAMETPEQIELFINAFNHTARRVKDCISVAGMELPEQLIKTGTENIQLFIETLAKKHAQYVYFTKDENLNDNSIVKY